AFEHGALNEAGVEHVGKPHVDAVNGLAFNLFADVKPPGWTACNPPVLWIFEHNILRRIEPAGEGRNLAETHSALAAGMNNAAVLGPALLSGHLPLGSSGGDEHLARRCAGFAHVILGTAHRSAASRIHVAVDAVALEVHRRLDDLNSDLAPIAFELFREHHRNRSVAPLPHLGARIAQDDAVVRMNDDPCVDLGSTLGSSRRPRPDWNLESKHESTRSRAGQKGSAVDRLARCHGTLHPSQAPAAAWMAARMR